MWDFHRYWIYAVLLLALVGCVSCSGNTKDAAGLLKSMSKNCQHGPKDQDAEFPEGDESPEHVHVECADPARVSL
jgi:hypothetical protein